ncbi:hypothetical protein BN946_scf184940.g93 [Trametes cinnabarina]|uniref:Uncharacterized protein n=1 Tax=Pycnoporus cinnabarinus TaxID=5643 RepID=A0A060SCK9_PYCCI|nr:hypothetical protein BN946_scf184940.g93 [Trametes cinnabarina]
MTTWLQRQEALEREVQHGDGQDEDGESADQDEDQDEGDSDEDSESDDVAGVGESQPPPDDEDVKALRQLVNSNVARAYYVPLTPTARQVSLSTLTSSYGTPDFHQELNDFLRDYRPGAPLATEFSTFDLYHSLGLLLPPNIHISNEKRICRLRAAPAVPRINDKKAVAARFDCGLFIDDDALYRARGGLEGLRPGQVRAIFRLPDWMGGSEPLLYVNWFRPFRTPDTITGLPPTSHSTRVRRRNATVVSIRDLVRTCHLMPKFGAEDLGVVDSWMLKDPDSDILDEPNMTFLLNRYYDFHTFYLLSQ